ncbi:MAG: GAF domain-containing protein [Planctomycetaceae bacterium]|nr:GAF domain-containing protein [Planctomycetaceae bacterium]
MTVVPSGDTPRTTQADNFLGQPKFDVIRQLAISLLRRNTLHDLCWEIATTIGSLPGFEDSVVYLLEDGHLVQTAAYGLKATPQRHIVNPLIIPLGQGIVGHVAATGVAELIYDTTDDPRYIRDEYAGRAEISVPVVYQDRVIAVLDSEHEQVGAYTPQHLEILQAMANVCAPRIASAIVEQTNEQVRQELQTLNSQLEERVQQRTAQLVAARDASEKQRDRLRTVLHSIQNGLIVLNDEQRIDLISPSASALLEVDQQQALGTHIGHVLHIDGIKDLPAEIRRLQQSDHTEDGVLQLGSGRIRDIRWNVGAMGAEECVIVLSDVTDYKYLTRQTQQLDRMQSLGVLAGGIAHDFNNNLAAIDASLACIPTQSGSPQEKALEVAAQASAAAAQLTKQLMTYAKGGKPVRRPTVLTEILDLAVDLATSGSSIRVERRVDDNLPLVDVDPGQMTQVFSNIVLNAAQAMPDRPARQSGRCP